MKPFTAFFLLIMITLIACQEEKGKKQRLTWQDKKQEIADSLANCSTIQDSIVCINRFAYRDAIHGSGPFHIDNIDSENNSWAWEASRFYRLFLKDSLSVNCSGNADFNSALYKEFLAGKVVPHNYAIGIPEKDSGHMLNLLLKRDSIEKYYLVDPMFNIVYTDKGGNLIDLRKMIYWARKGSTDKYEIRSRIEKAQYFKRSKYLSPKNATYDTAYDHFLIKSQNPGYRYVLQCPRTLNDYLDTEFDSTYRWIADHYGYDGLLFHEPEDFKYCVLFIDDIYGPYAHNIKKELRTYLDSDLNRLDSLFYPNTKN